MSMTKDIRQQKSMLKHMIQSMESTIEEGFDAYAEGIQEFLSGIDRGDFIETMGMKSVLNVYSSKEELNEFIANKTYDGVTYTSRDDVLTDFYNEVLKDKATQHWQGMKQSMLNQGLIEESMSGAIHITEKFWEMQKEGITHLTSQVEALDTMEEISATAEYYTSLRDGKEKEVIATKLVLAEFEAKNEIHVCPTCNRKGDCPLPPAYLYRKGLLGSLYKEIFGSTFYGMFDDYTEEDETSSEYEGINYA